VNHTPERPKDTASADAALTTVANPRRTRVGADGPVPLAGATATSQG